MKIYANGCSCVWGQELLDNNQYNQKNKERSFPAQIGAINDAYPGSSNQAIANRTLDFCRTHNVEVAIIGWTESSRINVFNPNAKVKDRLGQSTIGINEDLDIFKKCFMNTDLLNLQTYNIIESTYHWLQANNIRPIFFFSFKSYYECNVPTLWSGKTWLNQYAQEKGYPNPRIRHPNQQEHDWLADYILDML